MGVLKKLIHFYARQIESGFDFKTLLFLESLKILEIMENQKSLFVPLQYNEDLESKNEGFVKNLYDHCRGKLVSP